MSFVVMIMKEESYHAAEESSYMFESTIWKLRRGELGYITDVTDVKWRGSRR